MLFPHAKDGFHIEMSLKKVGKRVIKYPNEEEEVFERRHREFVTMKEYYCFKLMIRLCECISLKNNRTYYNYIFKFYFHVLVVYHFDFTCSSLLQNANQTLFYSL